MDNNMITEDIYNNYFGKKVSESTAEPLNPNEIVYKDQKSKRLHLQESVRITKNYNYAIQNLADDNIDDVEILANILKKLCNAAWGVGWGELSPDLKQGEDASKVLMPQITVDINTRDVAEGIGGLKPTLYDVIDEEDAEGNPTGDTFLIYRQWYDCNVEFNFYGRTNKETRQLQKKFETLMFLYTGYLKRNGISEIIFSKEVSPKCSLNYIENTPMRCIYYYIRFETITPIRQSLINSINLEIGASQVTSDKVRTVIEANKTKSVIELDFFEGDTGITYDFNN